ncbi:MAG TPA: ImmA/IrrE family metallo-endopeptidase [Terriglobales bacterium]|nr:ImmA/IrrE family metallo-endopeptidase [Terriglobales bacterium]
MPDAAQLKGVLRKLSLSEAAREMVRRKWLQPGTGDDKVAERGHALFDFLFSRNAHRPAFAMFKGRRLSSQRDLIEEVSTMAWVAHVTDVAQSRSHTVKFRPEAISDEFVHRLTKLSVLDDGPRKALAAVQAIGVAVVVESGLPGMSVDGASFHSRQAGPVLALTLRHDRLDNFWFTLLHELGHLALHLTDPGDDVFVDSVDESVSDEQEAEAEADAFAKDGLVPRDTWLRSDARRLGSESSVLSLAKQLGIHPSIVAGRIRYERREFRIFTDLVGIGRVRDFIFAG